MYDTLVLLMLKFFAISLRNMAPYNWFKLRHHLYHPYLIKTIFSAQQISASSSPTDVFTYVRWDDLLVTDAFGVFVCKELGLDGSSSVRLISFKTKLAMDFYL